VVAKIFHDESAVVAAMIIVMERIGEGNLFI
jgi:hypothetical protein